MNKSFNINRIEANFKSVLQTAPRILGNDAVNFFTDSFRRQGWLGNTLEPWAKRKVNNRANNGRAILVKTARLKRGTRITKIEGTTTYIGNDAPYAKAHNEGFKGSVKVKAHNRNKYTSTRIGTGRFTKKGTERTRVVQNLAGSIPVKGYTKKVNLPKRQFMGSSPYLQKQLNRRLLAECLKGLRK